MRLGARVNTVADLQLHDCAWGRIGCDSCGSRRPPLSRFRYSADHLIPMCVWFRSSHHLQESEFRIWGQAQAKMNP